MSRGLLKCLLIMHSYLLFNPSSSADIHGPVGTDPSSVSSPPAADAAAPTPVEPRWVTEHLTAARYVRKHATNSDIVPSTPPVFEVVTLPQETPAEKEASGPQKPQWHPNLPVVRHTLSLAPIHTHAGLKATSPRLLLIPLSPQSGSSLSALLESILPERVRHLITLGPMPESYSAEFQPVRFTDYRTWNRPVPLTVTSRSDEHLGAGRVSTITVTPEPASYATAQSSKAEISADVQGAPSQAFGGVLIEEPTTKVIRHLHVDVSTPGLLDPSALRTASQWLGATVADGGSVAVVAMETPGHQSADGEDLNLMTMGGQLALGMAVRKNAAKWRKDHPQVTENHHPAATMLGSFARELHALHPELLGHVDHLCAQLEIDCSRRDAGPSASGRSPHQVFPSTLSALRRGAVAMPDTQGIRLSSWRPLKDGDPLAHQVQAQTQTSAMEDAQEETKEEDTASIASTSTFDPEGSTGWSSGTSDAGTMFEAEFGNRSRTYSTGSTDSDDSTGSTSTTGSLSTQA
ncbi:hypothetical protein DES44_3595 [Roseateles depolymerans]|uniref:Uncharacterized protein n=2 Tax=Roseateles depolymerans TaxID=76731 RepID=A0A0U3MPR8_9BURK|nr:hypothetical protein RD2015_396 [Roseateles depolymerans]REG15089.1 hypothetical protein DES44_3595 [Roseateles depolymerans]